MVPYTQVCRELALVGKRCGEECLDLTALESSLVWQLQVFFFPPKQVACAVFSIALHETGVFTFLKQLRNEKNKQKQKQGILLQASAHLWHSCIPSCYVCLTTKLCQKPSLNSGDSLYICVGASLSGLSALFKPERAYFTILYQLVHWTKQGQGTYLYVPHINIHHYIQVHTYTHMDTHIHTYITTYTSHYTQIHTCTHQYAHVITLINAHIAYTHILSQIYTQTYNKTWNKITIPLLTTSPKSLANFVVHYSL